MQVRHFKIIKIATGTVIMFKEGVKIPRHNLIPLK